MAVTAAPCTPDHCQYLRDGHQTHSIRAAPVADGARRAGESPWGWRDGMVTALDGGEATIRYVSEDAEVSVWHHRALPVVVADPVRLHEEYRLLGAPGAWFCVALTGGLGPVAAPEHPELAARESSPGIVDLATGNAVATDHMATELPDES